MDVDAKSESESEDEVRACCLPWPQHCSNVLLPRRRSSSHRVHWNSLKRAGV